MRLARGRPYQEEHEGQRREYASLDRAQVCRDEFGLSVRPRIRVLLVVVLG